LRLSAGAGVLVNHVAEGSAAQRANLRAGDVIAAAFGKPARDARETSREFDTHDVGEVVALEILRDGRRYATNLTLGVRQDISVATPAPEPAPATPPEGLGLTLRELPASQAQNLGLAAKPITVVSLVAPGSPAERAGLRPGDVLV